jgi:hypothetical protein
MPRHLHVILGCLLLASNTLRADDGKRANESAKEVAGTAEFLRGVPKHFATLKAVDLPSRRVTLLIEGDSVAKSWPLIPDAEIKVFGWWGRLQQFTLGDRVWVWFKTDRARQPVAVAMIADEMSEEDMHGPGVKVESDSADIVTLKPVKGTMRTVKTGDRKRVGLDLLKPGQPVYLQTASGNLRLILAPAEFEKRRAEQKLWLRNRWAEEGLPGAVAFAHTFSGELDFMLDHEAMRWGRSLQVGDKVTLMASPPVQAVVKHVKPWRERTQLRLVADGFAQAELMAGQRLHLKMTPPPAEVDTAKLPPDLDRRRDRAERVEWFLSSIYCTCKIGGDGCTGHFYTLASCNPNGCGMPNHVRELVGDMIDKGLMDRQIFDELTKELGPDMYRPHLQP